MSNVIISHLLAVLKFPKKIADFIIYAKAIQKAMAGNPNFASSAAKVTSTLADINALDAAETALHTKPATVTAATRNVALEAVKNDLRTLRNDVQNAADAKPASAESIIQSATMKVKVVKGRDAQIDEVFDGDESGSVLLLGKGAGAHQWQQSPDNGVTIVHLDPTLAANTNVNGLTPGSTVYFRNRLILPKGTYGPWSLWLSHMIR